MKNFLPLLCALLCALPALAQDQATDAPKEFGFNFGFEYSPDSHVTSVNVGYQRELGDGKSAAFDETVEGKNGIVESETLSFINEAGAVLGTLKSSFDQSGHLKSQSLTEGAAPPRALNWFATDTKSPILTVSGSALTASYTLHDGLLQQRVVSVKTPSSTNEITTTYDDLGRRKNDVTVGAQGKRNFVFDYDQDGLSSMHGDSSPNDKPFEVALTRNKQGQIGQFTTKTDGILDYRMTPSYDEAGQSTGNKMETFENGILSAIVTSNDNSAITESYKEGVLTSRKTIIIAKDADGNNTLQNIANEDFDENGKLSKRTEYNKDGTASAVTTYNADGTVKSTRKFDQGK